MEANAHLGKGLQGVVEEGASPVPRVFTSEDMFRTAVPASPGAVLCLPPHQWFHLEMTPVRQTDFAWIMVCVVV